MKAMNSHGNNLFLGIHSRIRKLVQYGFTNRYITSLEPEIKKVVDDCLDKVHNQDSFDLIEDLAKPLPAIVIAKMMGLPNEDLDQFQAWSEDLLVGVGGIGTSKEDVKKSGDAYEALIRYFEKVIISRFVILFLTLEYQLDQA